jgi:hypothetical protein
MVHLFTQATNPTDLILAITFVLVVLVPLLLGVAIEA